MRMLKGSKQAFIQCSLQGLHLDTCPLCFAESKAMHFPSQLNGSCLSAVSGLAQRDNSSSQLSCGAASCKERLPKGRFASLPGHQGVYTLQICC